MVLYHAVIGYLDLCNNFYVQFNEENSRAEAEINFSKLLFLKGPFHDKYPVSNEFKYEKMNIDFTLIEREQRVLSRLLKEFPGGPNEVTLNYQKYLDLPANKRFIPMLSLQVSPEEFPISREQIEKATLSYGKLLRVLESMFNDRIQK